MREEARRTQRNTAASDADRTNAQQQIQQSYVAEDKIISDHPASAAVPLASSEQALDENNLDRASKIAEVAEQRARVNLANPEDEKDAQQSKNELLSALNIHAAVADKHQDWATAKRDTDEIINLKPTDPKILEAAQAINAMAVSHLNRTNPALKNGTLNQPWANGGGEQNNMAGGAPGALGAKGAAANLPPAVANPQDTAEIKHLLQDAQTRLGIRDPEGALKAALQADKLDDKNAQTKLLAAIALMSLNRMEQALDMVNKAITLREGQGAAAANAAAPEKSWLAAAYTTRGRTEEALAQLENARKDYQRAVELDPAGQAQAATVFLQRLDDTLAAKPGAKVPSPSDSKRKRTGYLLIVAGLLVFGAAAAMMVKLKRGGAATSTAGGSKPTVLDDTPVTAQGLASGVSLGHYELRRPLGRGGMGEVWEAFDHSLNRLVAIKKLAGAAAQEPGALEGLIDEALKVAQLKHPNIVAIHFVFRGQQTGDVYLVFEHISEGTVMDAIQDGPLAPDRALDVVRGVAAALDYAHGAGVIHRDLKPANILLERGAPKVGDFGIARLTQHQDGTMTLRNAGTPAYMAPEQAMGVVSRQTDLYALAVSAYQMLTGQLPFPAQRPELKTSGEFMAATQRVQSLPRGVDAFFTRALNPDPKLRFKDGAELSAALERALEAVTPLPRAV